MSTYAVAVKSWVCGWLAGAWERGVEVCVVAWDVRSYGGGEVEGWMGGCREGSCGSRGSKSLWLLCLYVLLWLKVFVFAERFSVIVPPYASSSQ